MKTKVIILLFVVLSIFTSCSTHKIQSQLNESRKSNETLTERLLILESRVINTSKIKDEESNTEKIEFFNPGEVDNYADILLLMKERGEPYSDVGIVKSIEGVNSKTKEAQTGTTNESLSKQADFDKESNIDIKKTESIKSEIIPFLDKYKWHIGIGVILIIVFIFFRFKLIK